MNEGYFIRKDWCDKLNMDIPTSIDELNEFAYAAKSQFSLETVLLMGEGMDTLSSAWGVAATVASGSGFAYHREGDVLVADITSQVYKDYIQQLHQWYEDGIVSRNFTELDTSNMSDTWNSRTDDLCAIPNSLGLNSQESDVVALYATDLATYISEEIPKFVTGDRSFDTWDAFMADCEGMHVDELLEAYQGAYDRYFEK